MYSNDERNPSADTIYLVFFYFPFIKHVDKHSLLCNDTSNTGENSRAAVKKP